MNWIMHALVSKTRSKKLGDMYSHLDLQGTLAARIFCNLQGSQSPPFLLPLEAKFCAESDTEFMEPEKQKEGP